MVDLPNIWYTKSGSEINGLRVSSTYGQMEKTYARRNVDISFGKKVKDLSFSISGLLGQGNRSEQTFTDIYGSSYEMEKESKLDNNNVNIGLTYKKLSVRAIYDQMNTNTRDAYDAALSRAYPTNFTGYFFETKYDWAIGNKLTITPKLNFKRQRPWEFDGISDTLDAYETTVLITDRYGANITANWNVSPKVNIIMGTEAFYDYAESKRDVLFQNSGTSTIDYFNSAAFVQSIIKNKIANLTIGARIDNNNAFGKAFVPRLGLTKKINKLNFKLLWGNSFRAPSIQNFQTSYNGELKPEKSQTIEFETSYLLNRKMYFSVSVFDITTRNPIIYFIDTSSTANLASPEGYINKEANGSMGIEGEYRYKGKWGYVNMTYSYYTIASKTQVPDYSVDQNSSLSLAFPANKITLNSSINLTPSFFISPSFCYSGKRYGYDGIDSLGDYTLSEFKEQYFLNFYAGYNNIFVKGLDLSVGVFDILNEKVLYIQPYSGGHAPLPGVSREIIFKLRYQLHYKEK